MPIGDRALDLLIVLIERPGEIYTKAELSERVWGKKWVEDVNLRAAVAAVRKVLGHTDDGREYVSNVFGRGYAFSQAAERRTAPQRDDTPPSAMSRRQESGRLPTLLSRVIGRAEEIAMVGQLLERHRLVTVIGSGGIGKTTVAVRAAEEVQNHDCRALFVELTPVRRPDLVPGRIASALGAGGSVRDPTQWLLDHLEREQVLLVLDNCEHVAEAAAEMSETILQGARNVRILATSREPLRAEGETTLRLGCLGYPMFEGVTVATRALTFPAVELFVERVQAVSPGFALDDQHAPLVCDICRRLDGIALAIQLAASRVPAFGLSGVHSRLDDRFSLLSRGRRAALPRHQTLAAVFHWSFELLTEEERAVFSRLAVFAGRFSLEAAADVVGFGNVNRDDVAAVVGDLVDKSLVIFTEGGSAAAYHLLETARAYAKDRLLASGDASEAGRRHAEYVERGLRELQWRGLASGDPGAQSELADDVQGALSWALSGPQTGAFAAQLLSAAIPLLMHVGRTFELMYGIEQALEFEETQEGRLRLLLAMAGAVLLSRADEGVQLRLYGEAHRIARDLGDDDSTLQALWGLMVTRWQTRHARAALGWAEQFHELALSRERASDALVGRRMMATALHSLGEQAAAEQHLRNLLDHYPLSIRDADTQRFLFDQRVMALTFLACVLWVTGRTEEAHETVAQAVDEAIASGHAPNMFFALSVGACPIEIDTENRSAASRYISALYHHCGHHSSWRIYADALSMTLDLTGDDALAVATRLCALLALPDTQYLMNRNWYCARLGAALAARGHASRAREVLERAVSTAVEYEENWILPELLRLRALVADHREEREAQLSEALALARRYGAVAWEVRILEGLDGADRDGRAG